MNLPARYVERVNDLSGADWPLVIEAFNLLRYAVVVRADGVGRQVVISVFKLRYGRSSWPLETWPTCHFDSI